MNSPLSWQLSEIDLAGKWGWNVLAREHLCKLMKCLREYERCSLGQMRKEQRAKPVPAEHLCSGAQERLRELQRADTELWELRLGHEKWRIWGAIRGSIFSPLWWDPSHSVCREHRPRKGQRERHLKGKKR